MFLDACEADHLHGNVHAASVGVFENLCRAGRPSRWSTSEQIMQRDALARVDGSDRAADFDDGAGNFMTGCDEHESNASSPGPVVGVGVAYTGGLDLQKNVMLAGLGLVHLV